MSKLVAAFFLRRRIEGLRLPCCWKQLRAVSWSFRRSHDRSGAGSVETRLARRSGLSRRAVRRAARQHARVEAERRPRAHLEFGRGFPHRNDVVRVHLHAAHSGLLQSCGRRLPRCACRACATLRFSALRSVSVSSMLASASLRSRPPRSLRPPPSRRSRASAPRPRRVFRSDPPGTTPSTTRKVAG